MAEARTKLVCQGCGHEPAPEEPMPFQCSARREGDDCDHLLALQTTQPPPTLDLGDDDNPFVAFRSRAFSHGRWMASGKSDAAYVALVREIGSAIERVAGTNFHTTPWCKSTKLGVRFKDETGNVGGSHKARHLFGIALAIEVAERTGRLHTASLGTPERPLAIASCGNAALAAAMVAKAWGRTLQVFIPDWADPVVVTQLKALRANIVICERLPDSPPGDPCVLRFREAVANGAVPFACQGPENGLNIDGGKTLGYEIARDMAANSEPPLDHLFLQIGGGALASATIQALQETLPAAWDLPIIHAVQTKGCAPIADCWRRLAQELYGKLGGDPSAAITTSPADLAKWLTDNADPDISTALFQHALRHRSSYMRAVPSPSPSVASGILDDETYDWFVVVRAMLESGGWPVLVSERELATARNAAREATGVPVDATGAAGLAGATASRERAEISANANVGVLFTGIQREPS